MAAPPDVPSESLAKTAIAANFRAVLERVAAAESAAGRPPGAVRLVGVTKTVDIPAAAALLAAGCRDLGENRPEELARKAAAPELAGARWHLIGTYQRRKIRDTLAFVGCVQSVHSVDLLAALGRRAAELGRTGDAALPVLLEVNVSGEAQKQGFAPEEVPAALDAAALSTSLRVDGFMTMAPLGAPEDVLRRVFGGLRELRDRLATPSRPLRELSMGMSGDFEAAIREGATIVRVGTALFAPHGPHA
jgi:pyridoxal phosphate enzyme (YggS family)